MHTIFDPNFSLEKKLLSIGFIQIKDGEKTDIYQMANNSDRYENYITIYIHHYNSVLKSESFTTSMSVYVGDKDSNGSIIYEGIRPYTEEQFYHVFSSILPSKEYVEKLQDRLNENEYNLSRSKS